MRPKADPRVWLLDIDALRPALERVEKKARLLAAGEREAGALGKGDAGRDRRAVRIALRLLLARQNLGASASEPLRLNPSGKPHLPGADFDFSVSHSGGHALIALSKGCKIGVDLERTRTVRIAEPRRSQIHAAGAALVGGDRPRAGSSTPDHLAVLRAWTRLEAWAKARGTGIGSLLTDLGVMGSGARSAPAVAARNASKLSAAEGIAVLDLDLPGDLIGALAAQPAIRRDRVTVTRLTEAGVTKGPTPRP
jgi:4'-phosphopantetheinyl transferase